MRIVDDQIEHNSGLVRHGGNGRKVDHNRLSLAGLMLAQQ
jgi:hypothetical protein